MHKHDHHEDSHHHNQVGTTDQSGNVLTCPVMAGIPVDKNEASKEGWVREYKGKKHYFCCDSCVVSFDANPEQYAN